MTRHNIGARQTLLLFTVRNMKPAWKTLFVRIMTFLPLAVFSAADTWEMIVVDAEGGKAILENL